MNDNTDSFCKQFLAVYKSLTGDRAIEKNETFYAHAAYQPQLVRQKVTSSSNGQSSFAVMTNSFIGPIKDNFAQMIVKNGSPLFILFLGLLSKKSVVCRIFLFV